MRVEQADIDSLASFAGRAGDQTWWAPWAAVVPDWLRAFVGLEGLADGETVYAPLAVPALLQTEKYAFGATVGHPRVRPDHDERVVGLRLERQRRLVDHSHPLRLTVIPEEAVLDRPIGGRDVMAGQLAHLVKMASTPHVDLRVLPTAIGYHDALTGTFTVLDFAEAQPIAYCEMVNGAVYVQDQDQVEGYVRTVRQLHRKRMR